MWPNFFKGRNEEKKDPQEIVITRGDMEQRQAILYSSLFQVAAQLTQICHPNGGNPHEVLATFIAIYDPLEDWYKGAPLTGEIKKMLDRLLPEVPGY